MAHLKSKCMSFLLLALSVFNVQAEKALTLEQAVILAQSNDPWLHGSRLKQKAVEHRSEASGSLPDPKVSISLQNLPADSWDLDQEAMTQVKFGVSQQLARGNSLAIKQEQLKIESGKFAYLREDRKAKLKAKVSQLWLDAFLAQQTIALIETDRALFEQMAEVAKASYSNAVGRTRQQDVIRAQLEILQLEDRLTAETEKLEVAFAQLNQWLHRYEGESSSREFDFDALDHSMKIAGSMPSLTLLKPSLSQTSRFSRNQLAVLISQHPALVAIDVQHRVSKKVVELVEQAYKPQWALNASYAYREDMPSGESRADLLSVGVTFDLPLFTERKQDKQVAASIADAEAVKTDKLLLTKQMISQIEKELRRLNRLEDRQRLYREQLLTQTHDQAEASLTAYTNDDGDFAEVVRARIAELNARISALLIDVERLKTIARMNYFLTQSNASSAINSNRQRGGY